MSWYPLPEIITAEPFCEVPASYRRSGQRSVWADTNRGGAAIDCFVEGPSFGRDGNLYFVDIPWGRIFKAGPDGTVDLVAEYDGEPNGLRIHKDGSIYIADYKNGIMKLDPATGAVSEHCTRFRLESFKGCNDLAFASDGTLAWTDQGQTGHQDPTGRVFRLSPDGKLDCMMSGIPSPNGLVWSLDDKILYVAVTRANAVWRLPIMLDGAASKVGTFIQMGVRQAGPAALPGELAAGPFDHQHRVRRTGEQGPLHHRERYRHDPQSHPAGGRRNAVLAPVGRRT